VIAKVVIEGIKKVRREGRVETSLAKLEASAFVSLSGKEPLI
jgi:hypothetical protein